MKEVLEVNERASLLSMMKFTERVICMLDFVNLFSGDQAMFQKSIKAMPRDLVQELSSISFSDICVSDDLNRLIRSVLDHAQINTDSRKQISNKIC